MTSARRRSSPPASGPKQAARRSSVPPEPVHEERGLFKEQAWVDPEVVQALTEWGMRFQENSGMEFTSRAEMLRAFMITHLGLFAKNVRLKG